MHKSNYFFLRAGFEMRKVIHGSKDKLPWKKGTGYTLWFAILAHSIIYLIAMTESKSELHKEFELERLILFSDAVFAIAITLIIIEIKFPEVPKGASAEEVFNEFKPTLIQFAAFVISFFFIGMSWMRHLQLFRYLVKYNMGLVKRNLVFLFFIVCFPFSASGITEHIRPSFMLPLDIYIFNIAAVMVCQYGISNYIFRRKPQLCMEGREDEKKYLLMNSKWIALILSFTFVIYVVATVFLSQDPIYTALPSYLLVIMVFILRRRMKKSKPASMEEI